MNLDVSHFFLHTYNIEGLNMSLESALVSKIQILLRMNNCKSFDNPRFVSAYTDASLLTVKRNGWIERSSGWGMWGRDDNIRVLSSGPGPDWASDSSLAELCAVAASVAVCINHLDMSSNIMVIKTDSQTVCQWFGWSGGVIRNGRLPVCVEALKLMKRVLEMCLDSKIKLVVKWVKGHQAIVDVKGYFNARVDGMAKIARKTRKHTFWSAPIDSKDQPEVKDWDYRWVPWEGI